MLHFSLACQRFEINTSVESLQRESRSDLNWMPLSVRSLRAFHERFRAFPKWGQTRFRSLNNDTLFIIQSYLKLKKTVKILKIEKKELKYLFLIFNWLPIRIVHHYKTHCETRDLQYNKIDNRGREKLIIFVCTTYACGILFDLTFTDDKPLVICDQRTDKVIFIIWVFITNVTVYHLQYKREKSDL